jgi:hypothetical protein
MTINADKQFLARTDLEESSAFRETQVADRWLLGGSLLCGTVVLAPVGLFVIIYAIVRLQRARRLGWVRPLSVSVLAAFALVDGGINWIGWSLDIFANQTHILRAMGTGFGKLVDGGYYVDYNSGVIGGIADNGEKALALFSVLCIFPARAAATWAFLKMKRWGLRWMIITGWAYMFLWIGYFFNIMADFPHRIGASAFGVTGWWIFDIFYLTPFIQLPWLYSLDARRWNK